MASLVHTWGLEKLQRIYYDLSLLRCRPPTAPGQGAGGGCVRAMARDRRPTLSHGRGRGSKGSTQAEFQRPAHAVCSLYAVTTVSVGRWPAKATVIDTIGNPLPSEARADGFGELAASRAWAVSRTFARRR